MKGIILAAGAGTRLYPLTMATNKQLLPIYDKPMIYYPLSVLMQAGIRDILLVSSPHDLASFQRLLGDGSQAGLRLSYTVQPTPGGLAQAFLLGEDFIGEDEAALVLGDNIFHGAEADFRTLLEQAEANARQGRATIFGYQVPDPERFGIVEFDANGRVLSVEEKPRQPKSNYCITGLYFYPRGASGLARQVKPSWRGELEITSLNELYLQQGRLDVQLLGPGYTWLDTGTADSLVEAANFVRDTEAATGCRIGALEEIAYRQGWIDRAQLLAAAERNGKSGYGQLLQALAED